MDIGERIAAARKLRDLTQRHLEMKAGLSKGLIGNIEHGVSCPRTDTTARIAKALGVSINWLIYGNHPPKADRELMEKLVLYEKRMES